MPPMGDESGQLMERNRIVIMRAQKVTFIAPPKDYRSRVGAPCSAVARDLLGLGAFGPTVGHQLAPLEKVEVTRLVVQFSHDQGEVRGTHLSRIPMIGFVAVASCDFVRPESKSLDLTPT
jgi:hypothetical protein